MDLPDSVTISRGVLAVASLFGAGATAWIRLQMAHVQRPRWVAVLDFGLIAAFLFTGTLMTLAAVGPWEPTASEVRNWLVWALPFLVAWPTARAVVWIRMETKRANGDG